MFLKLLESFGLTGWVVHVLKSETTVPDGGSFKGKGRLSTEPHAGLNADDQRGVFAMSVMVTHILRAMTPQSYEPSGSYSIGIRVQMHR